MNDMNGLVLRPNDRICFGPNTIFLFKHKAREQSASMRDVADEPILFDFASDEILEEENKQEK